MALLVGATGCGGDPKDLAGEDLAGANLAEEDLAGADLSGANLGWAELSGIVAELNLPRPESTEEPAALTLPRTAVEPSPDRGA